MNPQTLLAFNAFGLVTVYKNFVFVNISSMCAGGTSFTTRTMRRIPEGFPEVEEYETASAVIAVIIDDTDKLLVVFNEQKLLNSSVHVGDLSGVNCVIIEAVHKLILKA